MSDSRARSIRRPHWLAFAAGILLTSSACVLTFFPADVSLPAREQAAAPAGNQASPPASDDGGQATLIAALATQVEGLSERLDAQATFVHYLATRPAPGFVTPLAPDGPTPNTALHGAVEIENGSCCVGGIAGETITVLVAFLADSPFGPITEMRVLAAPGRQTPPDFERAPWRPFVTSISYEVPIFINWTSFYIHVQFRDALGNLSPVYVDDIAVEGMPAPPTPTP